MPSDLAWRAVVLIVAAAVVSANAVNGESRDGLVQVLGPDQPGGTRKAHSKAHTGGDAFLEETETGRRGAFLSTSGSFTLSAGSNRAGNDEGLMDLGGGAQSKTLISQEASQAHEARHRQQLLDVTDLSDGSGSAAQTKATPAGQGAGYEAVKQIMGEKWMKETPDWAGGVGGPSDTSLYNSSCPDDLSKGKVAMMYEGVKAGQWTSSGQHTGKQGPPVWACVNFQGANAVLQFPLVAKRKFTAQQLAGLKKGPQTGLTGYKVQTKLGVMHPNGADPEVGLIAFKRVLCEVGNSSTSPLSCQVYKGAQCIRCAKKTVPLKDPDSPDMPLGTYKSFQFGYFPPDNKELKEGDYDGGGYSGGLKCTPVEGQFMPQKLSRNIAAGTETGADKDKNPCRSKKFTGTITEFATRCVPAAFATGKLDGAFGCTEADNEYARTSIEMF